MAFPFGYFFNNQTLVIIMVVSYSVYRFRNICHLHASAMVEDSSFICIWRIELTF